MVQFQNIAPISENDIKLCKIYAAQQSKIKEEISPLQI